MPTLKDELSRISASNDGIRETLDRLGGHVDDLAVRLDIAREVQSRTKRTQTRLARVTVVLALVVVGLGAMTLQMYDNTQSIGRLQTDLRTSQCRTTGFFLSLVDDTANEPKTEEERERTEEFVKVYTEAYKTLECASLLGDD